MQKAEDFKRAIVYYTASRLVEDLAEAVRKQILSASNGIEIISVSHKPIDFGTNICVGIKPRSYITLYEQVLAGLEKTHEDAIIYLCEDDVFYHPSHFDFIPPRQNKIYFNLNRFYAHRNENYFARSIGKRALSQCVSYRKPLLEHIKEQVDARRRNIASPCIGPFLNFRSRFPNIDIRHESNFSESSRFNDKADMIWELDGWGTPRMFRATVGFRQHSINAAHHLHNIFNREHSGNPVVVPCFVRKMLPMVFESLKFKTGAEIGVKLGNFSEQICIGMRGDVKLRCIDPYHPSPTVGWDEAERRFVVARKKLEKYDVQFIKKTSLQAAEEDVPMGSLDFVYIDADHSFDAVMQDIIVWSDRVRCGGIVSGHDYDMESVGTAVDAYVKMHNYELFVTTKGEKYPDSSPSWFFAKG